MESGYLENGGLADGYFDAGDLECVKCMRLYCVEIAQSIQRFGNSLDAFRNDTDYFNSVSMSVWLISDLSVNFLSDAFKDVTREWVLWGLVRGIRNVFVHEFLTTRKEDVWEIATQDIPTLLKFCDGIIKMYDATLNAANDTTQSNVNE